MKKRELIHLLELDSRKHSPIDDAKVISGTPKTHRKRTNSEDKPKRPTDSKIGFHEPRLKRNWRKFETILKSHGVKRLYHFTDMRNYQSIVKHGGLYSWFHCEANGIEIPYPGGNARSRQLDLKYGLEDYVRLNFNPNPPMRHSADHIETVVIFEVDLSVIYWRDTKFSDVNATDRMAIRGEDLECFK